MGSLQVCTLKPHLFNFFMHLLLSIRCPDYTFGPFDNLCHYMCYCFRILCEIGIKMLCLWAAGMQRLFPGCPR